MFSDVSAASALTFCRVRMQPSLLQYYAGEPVHELTCCLLASVSGEVATFEMRGVIRLL